jgi:GNAT superfamily N-acetyltransferase
LLFGTYILITGLREAKIIIKISECSLAIPIYFHTFKEKMQAGTPLSYQLEVADDTIWFKNQNTTIGYCRYASNGDIEYIYVHPMYRLMGFGKALVDQARIQTGQMGHPQEPISPMGKRFFAALEQRPS